MLDTMILESTLALFSFTFCLHWTEYTHKLERKNRRYKTEAYKSYSILSILCVFSLSLQTFFFLFSSTTALHKHEKGSCSAISAIQATRDQGSNQKTILGLNKNNKNMKSWCQKALTESHKNWHSGEKWALQVKFHCLRLTHTHTSVVFVKFTS